MPESRIKKYYDNLNAGKLVGNKCTSCNHYTFPPTGTCEHCGSEKVAEVTLSGRGTLHFASHGAAPSPNPRFADRAPYTYGHVILEEGIPVQGIINGVEPTPEALGALFRHGPLPVVADIIQMQDLPVLGFKLA